MKRFLYIATLAVVSAFALSSCGIGTYTTNRMLTTSLMPDRVDMRLTLDDFVYIQDTEVSVTYNKYMFVSVLREINGREVSRRTVNRVSTKGRTWMPVSQNIERALYDAKQAIPDAEIFIPVSEVVETEKMFLGRKSKSTLVVRAYKLRK
jgi:hypothetical protein